MTTGGATEEPLARLTWQRVFGSANADELFLEIPAWSNVLYFVGGNGSGKSRTARALADELGGRYLSTDRLVSMMDFRTHPWGNVPAEYKGVPNNDQARKASKEWDKEFGGATAELHALRDQPEVGLKVAAFIRRTLNRTIIMREVSGYLDPLMQADGTEYSLFRHEGHGLRELVVLLTATYRQDWDLLVVDEPESHLHPSLVRIWLGELSKECESTGRRAVVITHEPSLVKPRSAADLNAIYLFAVNRRPKRLGDYVEPGTESRLGASLRLNPQLVGQVVFSPRPVLVEGSHDVAAFSTALNRLSTTEVVAQTDFVECGGSGRVALWFALCRRLELDIRAVADLDACFDSEVQRWMDSISEVESAYRSEVGVEPPKTHRVIADLITEANRVGTAKDERSRAEWLAAVPPTTGWATTRDRLLDIWRRAGLWLHSQGTLEDVLGTEKKGAVEAATAASTATAIDEVALWCAYELDLAATLGGFSERRDREDRSRHYGGSAGQPRQEIYLAACRGE